MSDWLKELNPYPIIILIDGEDEDFECPCPDCTGQG